MSKDKNLVAILLAILAAALYAIGSPRKNGNTALLLKRAMDGAREAGGKGQGITN